MKSHERILLESYEKNAAAPYTMSGLSRSLNNVKKMFTAPQRATSAVNYANQRVNNAAANMQHFTNNIPAAGADSAIDGLKVLEAKRNSLRDSWLRGKARALGESVGKKRNTVGIIGGGAAGGAAAGMLAMPNREEDPQGAMAYYQDPQATMIANQEPELSPEEIQLLQQYYSQAQY